MFKTTEMEADLKEQARVADLFDLYRIIDYKSHSIYNLKDGKLQKASGHCYDIWGIPAPCPNCISKHTCNEQCRHFKMESLNGAVFLIQSIPIDVDGHKFSLELANDMTNSLICRDTQSRVEVIDLINEFNSIAVHDPMTGLYNEKYVNDQLQLVSLSKSKHPKVICAGVSIDNIADIEKKHGKELAETVIKRIASILLEIENKPEIWAGKLKEWQFGLFFNGHNEKKISALAKDLSEKMNNITFRKGDAQIHAEVSVKIAEIIYGGESSSISELIFRELK